MKIAMIGHKRVPSREGGVEIVVEELATRFVKMGHRVDIYNRKGNNVQDKNADIENKKLKEYKGARLISIPTINKKGIDALLYSFFATIRALFGGYDVIHYHAEGPCAMLWIPHLFGIKTVATIHGLDWQRSKWGGLATKYLKFGEKIAAKYADEVVVLSKGVQKYFKDTYNRETHFIPNGVNPPEIKEAKIIKEKWGLEKDNYILFLARIVPEKGLHYLIEAYKQIDTDKKLVIAGGSSHTNDYLEKIQNMVKNDNRIIMTGFVQGQELEELYSNCYLYCLPSDIEGMPISLLEAMSYGCNCLVSDIEENVQVIDNYGEVFKKGDVTDLNKKLVQILENKTKEYDAYKIVNGITEKCNWQDIANKYITIFGKPSSRKEKVEDILLMLLIFATSFQGIFTSIPFFSYIDELLLIMIFGLEIFYYSKIGNNKENQTKRCVAIGIYILITIVTFLIRKYTFKAYIEEIVNQLKTIIMIEIFYYMGLSKKRFNKLFRFFIAINCLSALYGLCRYINIDGTKFIYGDKVRNGRLRLAGFSGHPIAMGFISLTIVIYNIEKKNKNKINYFMILFFAIILFLTYSRFPQAILAIYAVYKVIHIIKVKKIFVVVALIFIALCSIISKEKIINYFSSDLQETIRFYSIKKVPEILKEYPILGTGIGTYSCKASFKYNSFVYDKFNFEKKIVDYANKVSSSSFESAWAKILIETGLTGGIFYLFYFGMLIYEKYKNKNEIACFYVIVQIIGMIINPIYQIPFILIMAMYIAYDKNSK